MTKYKITKKKVLQAIATEPLRANTFFGNRDDDNSNCAVCAVGAILRNTRRNKFSSIDAMTACEYRYAAGHKPRRDNFLSILSIEFERAHNKVFNRLCDEYTKKHTWNKLPSPSTYSRFRKQSIELARMHAYSVAEAMCPNILEFEV